MKFFEFKKNFLVGMFLGVIFALAWFVIQGALNFLGIWQFAERSEPFNTTRGELGIFGPIVTTVTQLALTVVLLYFLSISLRSFGFYVASDLRRARRYTRIAKKLKLMLIWRFTIGFALISDALEGLQFIRVEEFAGNRNLGIVTGLQRVVHRRTKRVRWEFRVYFGDFPTFILGRWKWVEFSRCEKVITDAGQLIPLFFTAGFAGPRDLIVDTWEVGDVNLTIQKLKEREALLVAAGLADPDYPVNDDSKEENVEKKKNGNGGK